jgi:hypothetical protein
MRQVRWNLIGAKASQLFKRRAEIGFEDELFVVFQVKKKRVITEAGEFLAEEADIFARCPGVNYLRRAAIGKNARPVSVHLIKALDGIILRTQGHAAVFVFRNGDRHRVAKSAELVREIVHVDRAVRAEIVIESKENIAHCRAGRGL